MKDGKALRAALAACVWTLAAVQAAAELHSAHCLHGCLVGAPATNDVVVRPIYVLSSNDATKFADWAAYRVTRETIGPTDERRWRTEPGAGGGGDAGARGLRRRARGAGDGPGAPGAAGELHGDAALGDDELPLERHAAAERAEPGSMGVAGARGAGPCVVDGRRGRVRRGRSALRAADAAAAGADEPHVVPSGYWKVVSVAREGGVRAAGFVFDQDTPREARHCDQRHRTTVREIERRTGLDFFHGLAQARQDIIETAPPTLLSELGCGGGDGP